MFDDDSVCPDCGELWEECRCDDLVDEYDWDDLEREGRDDEYGSPGYYDDDDEEWN